MECSAVVRRRVASLAVGCAVVAGWGLSLSGCSGGGGALTSPSVSASGVASSAPGTTVRVYRVGSNRALTLVQEETTDDSGRCALEVSGDGPFVVTAADGGDRGEATGEARSSSAISRLDVVLCGLLVVVIAMASRARLQ